MARDRWRAEEKAWEETEGFRETLLLFFPRKEARALRRLARMLFESALESGDWDFLRRGSWTRAKLRAATRDLGHLTRFLRYVADSTGEDEESGFDPEEKARLEGIAARAAAEVGVIAAELEEEFFEGEGTWS